jgi:hypothetical protein
MDRSVADYFGKFQALGRQHQLSLSGDIEQSDLFESLLDQTSHHTTHSLREHFIQEGLQAVIGERPKLEARKDDIERLFRGEKLDLSIPNPLQERPLLSSLSLCASMGAILGSLLVFCLFRFIITAAPEASLFWAMIVGVPLGTYLVTHIIQEIENSSGRLESFQPLQFASLNFKKQLFISLLLFFPRLALASLIKGLSQHERVYDQARHRKAVESAVEQWLTVACPLLAGLCLTGGQAESKEKKEYKKYSVQLGEKLLRLQEAHRAELPVVAMELLNVARSVGFDLPNTALPALKQSIKEGVEHVVAEEPIVVTPAINAKSNNLRIWDGSLNRLYKCYDYIAEGDQVQVMESPVQINGELRKKGLVRRYWGEDAALEVEVNTC